MEVSWLEPTGREEDELSGVAKAVLERRLTYLSPLKLRNLERCARNVDEHGIVGDILEAGVALGGSTIVLARACPARTLHAYDVFGMIPPPGERDGPDVHARYADIASGTSRGLARDERYYGYRENLGAEVASAIHSFGLEQGTSVCLHEGLYEETLWPAGPVALAHIDCDWYGSIKTALERTHPHVTPGGFVVCDDYFNYSGARRAVDDFLAQRRDMSVIGGTTHLVLQRESAGGLPV